MRRLLFALCILAAGVGAGAANSAIECVWSFTKSQFYFDPGVDQFVMSYTGNCTDNGGFVGCCLYFSTDLLYSPNGSFWTQKSHANSPNNGNFCGETGATYSWGVACPTSPSGFYKLTAKVLDCNDGTIKGDLGQVIHQVP
jgi:hypothetical protein